VISYGFWPGDATVREPMFYTYTYPEPAELRRSCTGAGSSRLDRASRAGLMGLMPYEAVRAAEDPPAALMAFLESAYMAGTISAGWDSEAFRRLDAQDL
jgi:hypothetical protein